MKKTVKITLLFIFLGLSSYIILAINNKKTSKIKIAERIGIMPDFKLNALGGGLIDKDFLEGKKALIIFYSIDCDFCEAEAVQLKNNITFLKDVNVIMISSNEKKDIEKFKKDFQLDTSGFYFCQDKEEVLMKKFGIQGNPITFIYDDKGILLKRINGSTHFKNIKKYLK
ncbi:TlpA disulfide reductase family protein [Tenacibaculum ovolyticum]|uniref:peroxiredoxin family protein n=1 Tax=Tenacibaculum ovolyticum TaxID=104270 RepID=UPI000AB7C5C3|nr:TlpA disulfide reductase family protein [Tenacibaculum ovolyticum]WBX76112.1 TlpA disulfide reductase family protein [Tenacibaculum ovolyticum]